MIFLFYTQGYERLMTTLNILLNKTWNYWYYYYYFFKLSSILINLTINIFLSKNLSYFQKLIISVFALKFFKSFDSLAYYFSKFCKITFEGVWMFGRAQHSERCLFLVCASHPIAYPKIENNFFFFTPGRNHKWGRAERQL